MLTIRSIPSRFIIGLLGMACAAASAASTLVYSTNFSGPDYVAPGVTANGSGGIPTSVSGGPYAGSNGKSWSGDFLRGDDPGTGGVATLSLGNLSAHTGVRVDMLIGFLNSWDGAEGNDFLDLYIDGALAIHMTSNNASGSTASYGGGTVLVSGAQIDGSGTALDILVDMATAPALTFAHTGSTLLLQLQSSGSGWQGWPDEGWGLDDFSVTLTGTADSGNVPEPATLALLGLGLAGLAGLRKRRAA